MHPLTKRVITLLLIFLSVSIQAANPKTISAARNDKTITEKIKLQYQHNAELSSLNISISSYKGVVKLSGDVTDKQSLVDAFWLARTTPGVISVNVDDLEIKRSNTALIDAYITAKVESAVLKAKVLDDESIPLVGINATTVNGIVTISGTVKNSQSITAILKRAHAIKGVKKIISSLQVSN